jgi:hypothetical protein
MALTNYGELKTAIASWLNKSNLTSVIPDFIALAELDMRRDLRLAVMETLATGTLSGETLAHPDRFVEARRLVVGDDVYAYRTPEEYQLLADSSQNVFTSIGQSIYILGGTAGDDYSLIYKAGLAALTGDGNTNWILTNAPDIYLAGACRHGSAYLKDKEAELDWAARYSAAVERENRVAKATIHIGPLQMRAA